MAIYKIPLSFVVEVTLDVEWDGVQTEDSLWDAIEHVENNIDAYVDLPAGYIIAEGSCSANHNDAEYLRDNPKPTPQVGWGEGVSYVLPSFVTHNLKKG